LTGRGLYSQGVEKRESCRKGRKEEKRGLFLPKEERFKPVLSRKQPSRS